MSERLGHASVAITLDTYSHVLPGLQQAAAIQLDSVLNAAPQEAIADDGVTILWPSTETARPAKCQAGRFDAQ